MGKIFFHYLKPYYPRMAWGFVIKFTGTLMDLFLPWALAYMIDTVISVSGRREILLWGIFMLGCSVLAVLCNVLANRMASRVASDAIYVIREDLFAKVMYLPDQQADKMTRPSLLSRLTSDTYNVHQMLGRIQRLGVRAPILLVGGIAMTLMLDAALAGVLLATLPLLALVVVMVSKRSIPLYGELQESLDGFVRLVRENIAGIRVIKALSREDYERRRFGEINREVVERERRAAMTAAITNPAMNILLNLGLVAVVLVGALRVNSGLSEVGKILAFMTYFTIILNALLSISRMFVMVSKAAASAGRIAQVLETADEREWTAWAPEEKERREPGPSETVPPHVSFDHVSFSYNKVADNLRDISFSLKKGETLGIIGSTGSGKSTIASLLMRFYDADEGSVRIEGQDIRTMDLQGLRRRFGVAFQNDVLFAGTIYDNINMGRGLTREEAGKAVSHARARDFVEDKGGMEERLEIRGANLSGGQKQRLLIARALAACPEILILDDSSSALDYRTDAALRRELREHFASTTCIIIAQRVSSVMGADHILVLEEGRMAGYGTHQELMENCGIYQEIESSQMGQGGEEGWQTAAGQTGWS
ncbi:MAG: ABC transporter ATP-binding protein [Lachnospiraceae bacterium]|nr:ABC transporter ATP-binding protein [Lachnospiraceae bacterium]